MYNAFTKHTESVNAEPNNSAGIMLAYSCITEEREFDFRLRYVVSVSSKNSRPLLVFTQPLLKWIPGSIFLGVK
jgi:hypothetical protein